MPSLTSETPSAPAETKGACHFPSVFFSNAFLIFIALASLAILLTAPLDLGGNNEWRMSAYVSDAVENGNWAIQHDETGGLASKPPMFCWLSASATALTGRLNPITLYWPTAAATIGLGLVLFHLGKNLIGRRAAFFAGAIFLLSHVAFSQMATCRYDGLFSFFVALAALSAYRAWTLGASWTWFWVACAGATLTKGPLGLILASAGLLAAIWDRKSPDRKFFKGSHLPGIAIFLVITVGWFALAYRQVGFALIHKMIYQELFTHALGKEKEKLSGIDFYKPFLWFISEFAPWSILTILGIWRAWRKPASESGLRRFERFLVCWFIFGLVLFSLGGHQRIRLIYPLMPAAALLAGIQLQRLTESFSPVKLRNCVVVITVASLFVAGLFFHLISTKSKGFRETAAMREFASVLNEKVGNQFPFSHADPPFALSYFLGELHQFATYPVAADLLRGETPAFVAVQELPRLEKQLGSNAPAFFELMRWPEGSKPMVYIVSNHPRLEITPRVAVALGAFRLDMDNAQLKQARGHKFIFDATADTALVKIFNDSEETQTVRAGWSDSTAPLEEHQLKSGESWELKHVSPNSGSEVVYLGRQRIFR